VISDLGLSIVPKNIKPQNSSPNMKGGEIHPAVGDSPANGFEIR